ncbi:MAG TPA: Gmad2 immunoglobulin-like domain-containing protein [Candidatus Paceibacterota bacterium]|nr:Gmad2 immunoglobulin-like domain-containing protein [Candidatus Paceibacterota bacterium]
MKNKIAIIITAAVIILGGYFYFGSEKQANSPLNAAYAIDNVSYPLQNGKFEKEAAPGSASKETVSVFGAPIYGDLNGDGIKDAAVMLQRDSGGSGTFYYAAAAINDNGTYKGTNAVFLGDRIAPQNMEIRNGVLIVNYADRAANEPMTARPSFGKSEYLEVENNILAEAPIFIESPVDGAAVSSTISISGVAKGNWFFEASFPLILTDEKGNVIAQGHATAQGPWMTTDYVRFSGTLEFKKPVGVNSGILIFKKDNPSGLPQSDDSRAIRVAL